jgi:hypothetical protein
MVFCGVCALLIVLDLAIRFFSFRPIFVILDWIVVVVFLVIHLSMRHYLKILTFKNKAYWTDKPMPRRLLK